MTEFEHLAAREWLLTNGIGGFASGTLAGCATRRYHSLLTVALEPPSGRRMSVLGAIDETVILADGTEFPLATHVYEDGTVYPDGWRYITHADGQTTIFTLPDGSTLTRSYQLVKGTNTLRVEYRASTPLTLRIAPLVCWKDYHSLMRPWDGFPFHSEPGPTTTWSRWQFQATPDAPTVTFRSADAHWQRAGWWNERLFYAQEAERGFPATESLYCPAVATIALKVGKTVLLHIACDTPAKRVPLPEAQPPATGRPRSLVAWKKRLPLAEPFLSSSLPGPGQRTTILAGYPWFTDWGRDTFISLPGLCLATGHENTAREIIRSLVSWLKDGRIPNRFPDGGDSPAYNNVDGTLWFVRCIGLCGLADELRWPLAELIAAHREGRCGDGIFADSDGLLHAGDSHTNLTWMDAKVAGMPITPRYDRPVEVQALWINALRVAGERELAERAQATFLARFVRADGLGLYDCLLPDGTPDPAIRPNQVIAAALLDLPNTVNRAVLDTATEHLLTPYGLRTLSPSDPQFRPRYEGDSHQRDSAYHQGTVWPWLIGSYGDLYRKVHGPNADLQPLLAALWEHCHHDYGLGGIAEIFDATEPYRPNGCPWQAWSIAELLRISPYPFE